MRLEGTYPPGRAARGVQRDASAVQAGCCVGGAARPAAGAAGGELVAPFARDGAHAGLGITVTGQSASAAPNDAFTAACAGLSAAAAADATGARVVAVIGAAGRGSSAPDRGAAWAGPTGAAPDDAGAGGAAAATACAASLDGAGAGAASTCRSRAASNTCACAASAPRASFNTRASAERAGSDSAAMKPMAARSEERRVGKECRSRWSPYH